MKAVQIVEPNVLRIIEVQKPVLDEQNTVLVRMLAAGICGSDIGNLPWPPMRLLRIGIIGHEMVGRVGANASRSRHLKVGDRVIIIQVTSCGHCHPCKKTAQLLMI